MTPKPKQVRKHLQISQEEFAKLMAKKKEEDSFLDKILSVTKKDRGYSMESKPNMAGSTDSSQSMLDFTEARRMGLPAGDVDKYRSHRNAA